MASDDVIELGSSDEETEPAPKKRKPPLNAMVNIPNRLPLGVTVTPPKNTKTRINPACLIKGSIGQAVTVKKIPKANVNPFANIKIINGNPIKAPVIIRPQPGIKRNLQIPIKRNPNPPVTGLSIVNPLKSNPIGNIVRKAANKNKNISNQAVNNLNILKLNKPMPIKMPDFKKPTLKTTQLPPGITIKRTTPPSKGGKFKMNARSLNSPYTLVRVSNVNTGAQAMSSAPVFSQSQFGAVPTVNLDDDEPATSSAFGPQWYMRPEEQDKAEKEMTSEDQDPLADISLQIETGKDTENGIPVEKSKTTSPENSLLSHESSSLEIQNNKEPEKANYIEITIEDSPIKPMIAKKGFKVGEQLAITIEDSPVKDTTDKTDACDSNDEETCLPIESHSKKKLNYPKTVKAVAVVEIEFEPLPVEESTSEKITAPKESESCENTTSPPKESVNTEKGTGPSNSDIKNEKPRTVVECIDIVEIEESPVKPVEEVKLTTAKKKKPAKPAYKLTEQKETIVLEKKEKNKFSQIYQSFINLCFQLENSEDMKKIVEKKIKAYYLQVPKEYTESETFTDMVSSKIIAMRVSPEKMYLYIKDVVDELNLQRKLAKEQPTKEKEEQQNFLYGKDSEFDAKRQRQIRKLEKTLKKLHRAIQKLEEQEVDFDDEEDSVYLLTESEDDTSTKDGKPLSKEALIKRYKERSVRVHAKLCQLTNTKMPSEARVQIEPRTGQPKGPAKRLEKWINRKVSIGTPLPFPDFHDVLRCVREANQEDKLGWNDADIMEEARDLFMRCGKKLQRRRQENEWRMAASRIPAETPDPAEDSEELKRKLEDNRRVAARKETEVFNKYADRQNLLKLEAVEIGDKEAEESPLESDDEELVEVTDSLTNKKKRKDRLKRLLQEKSKVSGDKGNEPNTISTDDSQMDATIDSNEAGISTKNNEDVAKKDPLQTDFSKEPPKSNSSNQLNTVESDSSIKSSGDPNKVDSDVDELHLLEKLYSENERSNSVLGSSDTGSLIAISDTSSLNDKTSSDERRTKKTSSSIISIENSSYSESEDRNESWIETDAENFNRNKVVVETVDVNMELECSLDGIEKSTNKTNNGEYSGLFEDVLLAVSDEADDTEPRIRNRANETCINLVDDNISIGENTAIKTGGLDDDIEGSERDNSDKNTITDNNLIDDSISITESTIIETGDLDGDSEGSKCDKYDKNTLTDSSSVEGMEIEPIEILSENQSRLDNIVEIVSDGSLDSITKSPDASKERYLPSVEIIEDENSNSENINETTSQKSKENINDGIIYNTKIISVQNVDKDNINQSCEVSVESLEEETTVHYIQDISTIKKSNDVVNTIENIVKSMEGTADTKTEEDHAVQKTKEDDTISNKGNDESVDTSMKEMQVVIHTENNIQSISGKEAQVNNNSIPEAMEVD